MPFERFPGVELEVDHFEVGVYEAMVPAVPATFNRPQTVIRTSQAWEVRVEWDEIGQVAGLIPGNWIVDAYVESIGAGGEFKVGQWIGPLFAGHHMANIVVGAGVPALAAGELQTPFRLVITLTAERPDNTRYPMAGYLEGPILQFYRTP